MDLRTVLKTRLQLVQDLCEWSELTTPLDLLNRLERLLDRLSLSTSSQVLATTSGAVAAIEYHLAQFRDASLVEQLLTHASFWAAMRSIGEDIDGLHEALGLDSFEWEDTWENYRRSTLKRLEEQLKDESALREDVQGTEKARDVRMLLSAEQANVKASRSTLRKESQLAIENADEILSRLYWTADFAVPLWLVSPADVVMETRPIHTCSSGLIYRAQMHDETPVVVKVLDAELKKNDRLANTDAKKSVLVQVNLLRRLRHRNVVRFIGACHVSARPFIVSERAAMGTMAQYLEATKPDKKKIWRLFCEAARGLKYLHDWGFVCGDLTLDKLLIGADGHVRVSNFGLQRLPVNTKSNSPIGACFMASGCVDDVLTPSSDVYSLGILLIEALSGGSHSTDADLSSGKRNMGSSKRPVELSESEWRLVETMTAGDPSERARLGEVIEELIALTAN